MMQPIPWTSARIEEALEIVPGAASDRDGLVFTGVSTDSRTIGPQELFVALQGENFDGHTFIADLAGRGVKGFVVGNVFWSSLDRELKEKWNNGNCRFFPVDDTLAGLGKLARCQRLRANVKVVAITGSNGKTSTRKMAGGIFNRRFRTLTTQGNLNNEIGLPLTLLKLSRKHEWAVVEMGMNHPGEIERLARIALPDIGVITNTAACHLEGLGSVENVARAKAELLTGLGANGTAVLNLDDPRYEILAETAAANPGITRTLCFTVSDTDGDRVLAEDFTVSDTDGDRVLAENFTVSDTDGDRVRAENITPQGRGTGFTLVAGTGQRCEVLLPTPARFMVNNALAASAAALGAGISMADIADGLAGFEPVAGRMEIVQGFNNTTIMNDTYNANPNSVRAALETLGRSAGKAGCVAVLGDMLELGDRSKALHHGVGRAAAAAGVSRLYAHGAMAGQVIDGAVAAGLPREMTLAGTKEEITAAVMENTAENAWILVKGSRGMRLEKIVNKLIEFPANTPGRT
ncbi:MAG: UDP-N-acetylmuramoyl-tripeptide--D-alanyl-D-alanine ligase [Desulfobacteraceae bacterium]|nr:UDP-N-acetylmuramoyl-tripeptide--D-alanyl-D-alanine ligase [Desulfobacteraceae bacterium]